MPGKQQPDGIDSTALEITARWRETREWWSGESQREIVRFIDSSGIRRERSWDLPPYNPHRLKNRGSPAIDPFENREEWNLRISKRRDEKVAQACGLIPDESNVSLNFGGSSTSYVPLQILSGYSFGKGTMLAEEIPILCAGFGAKSAGLADLFSLSGAVEFARRCKACGIKPLIGATVELPCGGRIALIAKSKIGYEQLSGLITKCHLSEPRQFPLCTWDWLMRWSRDLICLTGGDWGPINLYLAHRNLSGASQTLQRLNSIYGNSNVFVQIERSFLPWEIQVNGLLLELADSYGNTSVAGGPITHARPSHFPAQDVIVCVDTLCQIEEVIGRKPRRHPLQPQLERPRPERAINAEKYLRTATEMASLFSDRLDLLENTCRLADKCDDDVMPNRTRLPQMFPNAALMLREIAFAGALERHKHISAKLRRQLDLELDRIIRLNFAEHFLTAWDMCEWARKQGILFSGRGSVVDAAISYCLGFSRIDALKHNLHFDRFLPGDGSKRPDIDIDFEAHRREDVRTYLTTKYGVERVATVAAVGTYCTRGIIREVGKVLGISNDAIGYLAERMHGGVTPNELESAIANRPELAGANVPKERFRWVFELAERLQDLPRNIRSHSSGVVISSRPIYETVPVMWSATEIDLREDQDSALSLPNPSLSLREREGLTNLRIIQWDKRSAKYYFDKFDILCLRGQDVLSGAQERIRISTSDPRFDVESIPLDDEETYRAMRSGELIGIPQSASPAMRQAHIRVRTANLHDASLVQAGIRPGVGGAVKINELIARRKGKPFSFEHPDLEGILGITYGIVVFQEQIDQLLQTFAGYSSGEAEETRENIHKYRREDFGSSIREQVIQRIIGNGYEEAVAEKIFTLVSEFKGYGFAQGHALAFAEISIRSIYCQQNFPAEYFASILDAQPAGYYGPATLANEARSRGVAMLAPCVNRSGFKFQVEDVLSSMDPRIVLPNGGIRTSLSQISGISAETIERIVSERSTGPYLSFFDFTNRAKPDRDELERLILCGALDDLSPNRRAMLLAIPDAINHSELTSAAERGLKLGIHEPELRLDLDDFSLPEKAILEREILDMDIDRHLVAFERDRITSKGGKTADEIKKMPGGIKCMAVGNPIRLRFPPTPSGKRVVFFDLEDETGLLNVTCFDAVYRRDGHSIVCSPYVTILGETQDRDGHTAFLAQRVFPYRPTLSGSVDDPSVLPIRTGDFLMGGGAKGGLLRTRT